MWANVLRFKEEFLGEGLVQTYAGAAAFERMIRVHLISRTSIAGRPSTQPEEPLSCSVFADLKTVRAEGIAQRTADIDLAFTGSLPRALMKGECYVNIQLSSNCSITNPLVDDQIIDAQLLVPNHKPFHGRLISRETVFFENIPVDPVGQPETGRLIIRGLRVDASQTGSTDHSRSLLSN